MHPLPTLLPTAATDAIQDFYKAAVEELQGAEAKSNVISKCVGGWVNMCIAHQHHLAADDYVSMLLDLDVQQCMQRNLC